MHTRVDEGAVFLETPSPISVVSDPCMILVTLVYWEDEKVYRSLLLCGNEWVEQHARSCARRATKSEHCVRSKNDERLRGKMRATTLRG